MLRMRNLLLLFAVFGLSVVSAKTYSIQLDTKALLGTTALQAGQYKVKLDGNKAVLTNVDNRKSVEANVKVNTETRKYDYTALEMRKASDGEHLQAIELGGTNMRLQFQ